VDTLGAVVASCSPSTSLPRLVLAHACVRDLHVISCDLECSEYLLTKAGALEIARDRVEVACAGMCKHYCGRLVEGNMMPP
jgi:hypothetical protein